jgi:cell division protein FtsB
MARRKVRNDEVLRRAVPTSEGAPVSYTSRVIDIEEAQQARRERRQSVPAGRSRRMKEERESEERARKSFVTGRRVIFCIVVMCLIAITAVSGRNVLALKADAAAAKEELSLIQEKKARLEEELASVGELSYIEAQARERLHMIKPGEILYIFRD